MEKVNLDVIKPWIQKRITELLGGIEDEVLIAYVFELLESSRVSSNVTLCNLLPVFFVQNFMSVGLSFLIL